MSNIENRKEGCIKIKKIWSFARKQTGNNGSSLPDLDQHRIKSLFHFWNIRLKVE